jgi:hypothetical protein
VFGIPAAIARGFGLRILMLFGGHDIHSLTVCGVSLAIHRPTAGLRRRYVVEDGRGVADTGEYAASAAN